MADLMVEPLSRRSVATERLFSESERGQQLLVTGRVLGRGRLRRHQPDPVPASLVKGG